MAGMVRAVEMTVNPSAAPVMLIRSVGSLGIWSVLMLMVKVPEPDDAAGRIFMVVSWLVIW